MRADSKRRVVYVLEHRDDEDDKYVRGVYTAKADAERDRFTEERGLGSSLRHNDVCCVVSEWPLVERVR